MTQIEKDQLIADAEAILASAQDQLNAAAAALTSAQEAVVAAQALPVDPPPPPPPMARIDVRPLIADGYMDAQLNPASNSRVELVFHPVTNEMGQVTQRIVSGAVGQAPNSLITSLPEYDGSLVLQPSTDNLGCVLEFSPTLNIASIEAYKETGEVLGVPAVIA